MRGNAFCCPEWRELDLRRHRDRAENSGTVADTFGIIRQLMQPVPHEHH